MLTSPKDIIDYLDARIIPKMEPWELDAGFGLAANFEIRVVDGHSTPRTEVFHDGRWTPFSPTTSWKDFGATVTRVDLVLSTHNVAPPTDDTRDEEPETPWFGAHARISGTSFDTRTDLRHAAAMAATAYGRQMDWRMVSALWTKDATPQPVG